MEAFDGEYLLKAEVWCLRDPVESRVDIEVTKNRKVSSQVDCVWFPQELSRSRGTGVGGLCGEAVDATRFANKWNEITRIVT